MKFLKTISRFIILTIAITAQSCNECKQIACPKDIEVGKCTQTVFPYRLGDKLTFVNLDKDTLNFTCVKDTIVNENGTKFDRVQEACCDSYTVNDINILLNNSEGEYIAILTRNAIYGMLIITIKVDSTKISNQWDLPSECPDGIGLDLTSVILAGEEFKDVVLPDDDEPLIFIAPKSEGVIGFRLDGKEWRKI